jgi:hypothetical protein
VIQGVIGRPGWTTFRAVLALVCVVPTAGAQIVRGVVLDSVRHPIEGAQVSFVDAATRDVPGTVRSGTNGRFVLHAEKASTLTIRPLGFDLRRTERLGYSVDSAELGHYGAIHVGDLVRAHALASVVLRETDQGAVLAYAYETFRTCQPDVYLDGVLKNPGRRQLMRDRLYLYSPLDAQVDAMAIGQLEGIAADRIYGIEVYSGRQIPPLSLGGDFGKTGTLCGIIAIWTKAFALRAAKAAPPGDPPPPVL